MRDVQGNSKAKSSSVPMDPQEELDGSSLSRCDPLVSSRDSTNHPILTKFDPLLASSTPTVSFPTPGSIDVHQPHPPVGGIPPLAGVSLSKRQRSPNWTIKEDEQLARSWVEISGNPLFNPAEQRGEEFFKRICNHFNRHWHGIPRTPAGIRERWGILQPACLRFNTIYHKILVHCRETQPEAGMEHCRRLAHECFTEQAVSRTQRHRQFQYESVWEIIRDTPKFRTITQSKSSPSVHSSFNSPGLNTISDFHSIKSIKFNRQLKTSNEDLDLLAFTPSIETEHELLRQPSSSRRAPSSQIENKKRKASGSLFLSPQDHESDPESEVSSNNSMRSDGDGGNQRGRFRKKISSFSQAGLAFEREKFLVDKEERSKESIRKDKELDLRIMASRRDDLMLDLKIIQTSPTDCPDETSRRALELIKTAVLKKHSSTTN